MRKVEVSLDINSDGRKLISAFTELASLRDWWKVERAFIERKAGGLYTLAWNVSDSGFGFVTSGIIKEYDPERLLLIEKLVYLNPERCILGPMSLRVQAKPKGQGVELYLCQDGYGVGVDWDWYYQAVESTWPIVAKELKAFLER